MHTLDVLGLAGYFVILVVIGYLSTRRVKTSDDFAVAGNRITWPILFATLAASFLGGGASLGRAGKAFSDGYAFMFASCAFPLATVLAGLFVAPRLKRYAGAQTVGDIMAHHFGAPARLFTGLFSLIYCVGILGAQALAIGTVFNAVLGIDVRNGILLGMAVVLLYSTLGGLWAVIQTDVLQFLMLAIFIPLAMLMGVQQVGGADALIERLPALHFSVLGEYSAGVFIGIFVAYLLGETLVPPYTQRALAAPDSRNARVGYTLAGCFGFVFYFISATIGLLALVLYPDISPDQAMPELIRHSLPAGITGLVLASLLAVVMSTADSYLNSSAVVFVRDIYQSFINPRLSDSKRLWIERGVTLAIGAGAVVFAIYASSIIDALLLSYSLWAPTVLIPFLLAVLFDLYCSRTALWAILAGAAVTIFWQWGPLQLEPRTGVSALIAGVLANLLVFTAVYRLFHLPNPDSGGN